MGLLEMFRRKSLTDISTKSYPDPRDALIDLERILKINPSEVKEFDWALYNQGVSGVNQNLFGNEFNSIPSVDTMMSLHVRESSITAPVNAISRQFQSASFEVLGRGQAPDVLHDPGIEDAATFHSSAITVLILTGNSFIWFRPDGKGMVRMPTNRINISYKNGMVDKYVLMQDHLTPAMEIPASEMCHIKLPNPYNMYVGLPPLMSLSLPTLISRYGQEFAISFFLRGGLMSGVIESEFNDAPQLKKLILTLQQAAGSRRNSFSDKVLPHGAKFVAMAQKFSDIMLLDLCKYADSKILSTLGVPPVMVGSTESVNFANAREQREMFWRETVRPYQRIYCAALQRTLTGLSLMKKGQKLFLDNTHVPELSDFDVELGRDSKLMGALTVNERRKRLGYEPIAGGDVIAQLAKVNRDSQGQETVASNGQAGRPELVDQQPENARAGDAKSFFKSPQTFDLKNLGYKEANEDLERIVENWVTLVVEQILESPEREDMPEVVSTLAEGYSSAFVAKVTVDMANAWDTALANTFKNPTANSIVIENMRERSLSALNDEVSGFAKGRFKGFSETASTSMYDLINQAISEGKTISDIRFELAKNWKEAYKNQFWTIANTEYRSAMSLANNNFGNTLGKVAKRMSKKWHTMDDGSVRKDHLGLDEVEKTGTHEEVMAASFIPGTTLRYPRDPQSGAENVVNCRCILTYEVLEYNHEEPKA